MDDPIPANDAQVVSATFPGTDVIVSPRPLDLSPDGGGTVSQTHALASLVG